MADQPDVALLQAQIDGELLRRFTVQRERWGMTNRSMLERILQNALPVWEQTEGPPARSTIDDAAAAILSSL